MLLDPLISNNDIAGWQHRAILVLFLVQNQPKLALKYSRIRKPPHKDLADIQLHVRKYFLFSKNFWSYYFALIHFRLRFCWRTA